MLNAGLGGGSCPACAGQRFVDALCSLSFLHAVVSRRPYSRPLRLPLTCLGHLLLCGGALCLAAGYLSDDCSDPSAPELPGHRAAAYFLAGGSGVLALAALVDGGAVLGAMLTRRRARLRQHFQRMSGVLGEVVAQEGLKAAAPAVWPGGDGDTDAAFRQIDSDGTGRVSLLQILAAEHLFWPGGGTAASSGSSTPRLLSPLSDGLLAPKAPASQDALTEDGLELELLSAERDEQSAPEPAQHLRHPLTGSTAALRSSRRRRVQSGELRRLGTDPESALRTSFVLSAATTRAPTPSTSVRRQRRRPHSPSARSLGRPSQSWLLPASVKDRAAEKSEAAVNPRRSLRQSGQSFALADGDPSLVHARTDTIDV
eukprot:TRINITY_DN2232_c2_g2_i1.p1 TRINITY_DN2232_c2_g2~~TRINITY_DN2232_c2_g2_i1.p1  ORF type:complete len:371 (+),score=79.58 TRINITY_DN2232_c2_g2_i1:3-1115(+)